MEARGVNVIDQYLSAHAAAYHSDCVEGTSGLPSESADFAVFSPPFEALFVYSASDRDMGNSHGGTEFSRHLFYLAEQMFRVMKPGTIVAIHCMDLPTTLTHHGYIGFIDFPARLREVYERAGFIYHCPKITIWKDPEVAANRTYARQLTHHEMCKDSSMSGVGAPDYILIMRKPGHREPPITHDGDALAIKDDSGKPRHWQRWASPVWGWHVDNAEMMLRRLAVAINSGDEDAAANIATTLASRAHDGHGLPPVPEFVWATANGLWTDGFVDYESPRAGNPDKRGIDQGDTLNFRAARENEDERHICIAAGSLVLTYDGYKPIETVAVGDRVLSHAGKWRTVTAKRYNGRSGVIKVEAQGVPHLVLTPTHKLWTRDGRGDVGKSKSRMKRSDPVWVNAIDTLSSYVHLPLPPEEESDLSAHEWWIVGRWLGDGYFDKRGHAHICCGKHETSKLVGMLGDRAGFVAKNVKTADHVTVLDPTGNLRRMLRRCGRLAHGKVLPGEAIALGHEKAEALLSGYMSADGHHAAKYDRWQATSVSRPLLLGLAMIAQRARGVVASVYAGRKAGTCKIEGRTVKTRDEWVLSVPPRNMSGAILDDGAWKKVRRISDAGGADVWDLQVEVDESFVVEGCAVHNCPLQVGVVKRLIDLYSRAGEIVLTPFMGIGTEVVCAVEMGRRGVGFELKGSYFRQAVEHIKRVEPGAKGQQLDLLGTASKPSGRCSGCDTEGPIGECQVCGAEVRS